MSIQQLRSSPVPVRLVVPSDLRFRDISVRVEEDGMHFNIEALDMICRASGLSTESVLRDVAFLRRVLMLVYNHCLKNGQPRDPDFDRALFATEADIAMHERSLLDSTDVRLH